MGFGLTHNLTSSLGYSEYTQFAGTAAAVPPGASRVERDVVWRVTDDRRFEFCRPTKAGTHACQPVPDTGGDLVIIDPTNIGRANSVRTSTVAVGGTAVTMTVTNIQRRLATSRGTPLSPHYGIWVESLARFRHCRLRGNQPECNDCTFGPAKTPIAGRAESVAYLRHGQRIKDVLWIQEPLGKLFRCEAGAEGDPQCQLARFQ